MNKTASNRRIDTGLLVLRSAGFFLAFTFGWQKLSSYIALVRAGESLSTSGLAPLIRAMRLPAPGFLAVCAVLNESIGALCIGCGFLTRLAAVVGVVGMAVAMYVSLRLGEDPLRAALYLVIFFGIAVAGPGKFSIDYILQTRTRGN